MRERVCLHSFVRPIFLSFSWFFFSLSLSRLGSCASENTVELSGWVGVGGVVVVVGPSAVRVCGETTALKHFNFDLTVPEAWQQEDHQGAWCGAVDNEAVVAEALGRRHGVGTLLPLKDTAKTKSLSRT